MERSKLRGIGLLVGAMFGYDIYSALMSSPWAVESWGTTPDKAQSARRRVVRAMCQALIVGGAASWLTENPWPLVGAAVGSGYMWYEYERALATAAQNGTGGT